MNSMTTGSPSPAFPKKPFHCQNEHPHRSLALASLSAVLDRWIGKLFVSLTSAFSKLDADLMRVRGRV
jgi:hypothetical protein